MSFKMSGIKGNIQTDLEKLKTDGYMVIKNVLTDGQVNNYRTAMDAMFEKKFLKFNDGKVLPGWAGVTPEIGPLNSLHRHPRLITIVTKVLGSNWVYAHHSDLHQNKLTNWHTDILPDRLSHFQDKDPYDKGYYIVKICFLLQDHTNNEHGLWMRPGSHKAPDYRFANKGADMYDDVCIKSGPKDAIVFDQRILHRGQLAQYHQKFEQHRYLITYGYGRNNNYTTQHAAGTAFRQNQQRCEIKKQGGHANWVESINDNPGNEVSLSDVG
jgi:hypothetical protein